MCVVSMKAPDGTIVIIDVLSLFEKDPRFWNVKTDLRIVIMDVDWRDTSLAPWVMM